MTLGIRPALRDFSRDQRSFAAANRWPDRRSFEPPFSCLASFSVRRGLTTDSSLLNLLSPLPPPPLPAISKELMVNHAFFLNTQRLVALKQHTSPAEITTHPQQYPNLNEWLQSREHCAADSRARMGVKSLKDSRVLKQKRSAIYTLQALGRYPWIGVPQRDDALAVSTRGTRSSPAALMAPWSQG